ncbi:zinc alcohol dehydrogenase [Aspergillus sclerotialis]|uniref:Zinc alcohol dehydrogenase n=1 Tax=Aspergillus sclerotialis TaxID=2070753 RepID=A0A3A3A966_9EURO|nr:zinc alcohol dehydrogenase [Aspergillus sclerotialis]
MTDADTTLPSTMKAWLYSNTSGGIESHLTFNPTANAPGSLKHSQVLIQVLSASLNPADYKVPEMNSLAKLFIYMPASPGMDYCGRVVAKGTGATGIKLGTTVYGTLGKPAQFGSLGEYIVANVGEFAERPEGVEVDHLAAIGVAGQTAYQSIVPYVKEGDRVFVNGGSGGCGMFVIQLAKLLGSSVTTTCSTKNVEFCKELGADEVIDYTKEDVLEALKRDGQVYDHIIDHIGSPAELYKHSHLYLKPSKSFVQVGATSMTIFADRLIRPGFMGGGKRKYDILLFKNNRDHLAQLGQWVQQGKVKVAIDSVFDYDHPVEAFKKLRSGRARGKIIIHGPEKP